MLKTIYVLHDDSDYLLNFRAEQHVLQYVRFHLFFDVATHILKDYNRRLLLHECNSRE